MKECHSPSRTQWPLRYCLMRCSGSDSTPVADLHAQCRKCRKVARRGFETVSAMILLCTTAACTVWSPETRPRDWERAREEELPLLPPAATATGEGLRQHFHTVRGEGCREWPGATQFCMSSCARGTTATNAHAAQDGNATATNVSPD